MSYRQNIVLDGVEYQYSLLADGSANLLACRGAAGRLTVPAELDGHPLRRVSGAVFAAQPELEELHLPEGLERISAGAFRGCPKLTTVFLPDSLAVLPEDSFRDCFALRSVKLPEGLVEIQANAFRDCVSLPAIRLPEGLEELGMEAFAGCEGLIAINLPDSLRTLGCTLHGPLSPLWDRNAGERLDRYRNPFTRCAKLTQVHISPEHPRISFTGGLLIDRQRGLLAACLPMLYGERRSIPEGVLVVAVDAFTSCGDLRVITLPRSLYCLNEPDASAIDLSGASRSPLAAYTYRVYADTWAQRHVSLRGYRWALIGGDEPEGIPSPTLPESPAEAVEALPGDPPSTQDIPEPEAAPPCPPEAAEQASVEAEAPAREAVEAEPDDVYQAPDDACIAPSEAEAAFPDAPSGPAQAGETGSDPGEAITPSEIVEPAQGEPSDEPVSKEAASPSDIAEPVFSESGAPSAIVEPAQVEPAAAPAAESLFPENPGKPEAEPAGAAPGVEAPSEARIDSLFSEVDAASAAVTRALEDAQRLPEDVDAPRKGLRGLFRRLSGR